MTSRARGVLFNEDPDTNQDQALGLDAVIERAEAAFDAAEAEGESEVDVDLTAPLSEAGDEEGEADVDAEVDAASGDDAGDGAGEGADEADGAADEGAGDDPAAPGAAAEEAAALRFANQQAAEEAHRAAEDRMNRALWERDQALAQARAAQEYSQGLVQQAPVAGVPAEAELLQLAQTDPVSAFNAALEGGHDKVIGQIMASVNVDSQQFAAKAAMAAEEGDAEQAQVWQNRAINAATLHRDMLKADQQAAWQAQNAQVQEQFEQRLAPAEEERFRSVASAAATKVMTSDFFEGVDTSQYDAAIGQYVQQYPQIMGDWSPEAMEAGFLVAAQQVVYGGQAQMIQAMVDRKIAAAGKPAGKSKARSTGGGAGHKPAATAAPGSEQAQADEVRQSVQTGGRSGGMSVLFGGG